MCLSPRALLPFISHACVCTRFEFPLCIQIRKSSTHRERSEYHMIDMVQVNTTKWNRQKFIGSHTSSSQFFFFDMESNAWIIKIMMYIWPLLRRVRWALFIMSKMCFCMNCSLLDRVTLPYMCDKHEISKMNIMELCKNDIFILSSFFFLSLQLAVKLTHTHNSLSHMHGNGFMVSQANHNSNQHLKVYYIIHYSEF